MKQNRKNNTAIIAIVGSLILAVILVAGTMWMGARAIRATDRADAKTIPIFALTANAFDEDVQRSMQAGLNAHLSKPVQPELLFETLESLIKS